MVYWVSKEVAYSINRQIVRSVFVGDMITRVMNSETKIAIPDRYVLFSCLNESQNAEYQILL